MTSAAFDLQALSKLTLRLLKVALRFGNTSDALRRRSLFGQAVGC